MANAGVDVFEEVFKLIFTKLYDELTCARDRTANLKFRNTGCTANELKEKIQALFDSAKNKWAGVFDDDAKILLQPSHLRYVLLFIFQSKLDTVGIGMQSIKFRFQNKLRVRESS